MAKHKQLELEHAVLQERVGEMEHEDASRAERGRAGAAGLSTTSSAEMYAKLANSSDWSARQMGAIEGAHGLLVAPASSRLAHGRRFAQTAWRSWACRSWPSCSPSCGSRPPPRMRLRPALRRLRRSARLSVRSSARSATSAPPSESVKRRALTLSRRRRRWQAATQGRRHGAL